MGDHRAIIKIEVEFHGFKDKTDMWINWVQPLPSAACEFLEKCYEEGMANWDEKMQEYRKKEKEKEERKELERLKKKYEPTPREG